MSLQQSRRAAMTDIPDQASEAARLVSDFPGWEITYEKASGIWSAERKLSVSHLELHCAYIVDELRDKLAKASR
jgi:hypothetical protein